MFPDYSPIAAIEFQIIFAIIVGVISLISWITNKLKENQEEAKVGRKKNRQNDDPIRSEIESFLQDVLGTKPKKRNQVEEDDFLEVVEEQPRRRKKQQNRKRKTQQKPRRRQKKQNIEDRSVGQSGSTFGSGLREHVSEHMQLQHFENDIGHDINQSVSQHLGAFDPNGNDPDVVQVVSQSEELRQDILKMLHDPNEVKKAIILNLILTPPIAMRKK